MPPPSFLQLLTPDDEWQCIELSRLRLESTAPKCSSAWQNLCVQKGCEECTEYLDCVLHPDRSNPAYNTEDVPDATVLLSSASLHKQNPLFDPGYGPSRQGTFRPGGPPSSAQEPHSMSFGAALMAYHAELQAQHEAQCTGHAQQQQLARARTLEAILLQGQSSLSADSPRSGPLQSHFSLPTQSRK